MEYGKECGKGCRKQCRKTWSSIHIITLEASTTTNLLNGARPNVCYPSRARAPLEHPVRERAHDLVAVNSTFSIVFEVPEEFGESKYIFFLKIKPR